MVMPLSTSEIPSMEFTPDKLSQKMRAPTGRIGWLHGSTGNEKASFDLVIKDGLGREKFRKSYKGARPGELVNLPTQLGEELEVVIENIKNTNKLNVLLN